MTSIPQTQTAVQLIGPDELKFNPDKSVPTPNAYQILAKVEAVGLCFSDLKLLKQFTSHTRKSPVIKGIENDTLKEIPSYVPDEKATVPGHEAVVSVVSVGDQVKQAAVGRRYLVQTDYRWLPTKASNAAFGYNFEGALQQYVLMDERVITTPDGRSMLIPADGDLSASAIALVEPWACVEDAYAVVERTTLKNNSNMLIVADEDLAVDNAVVAELFDEYGQPATITLVGLEDVNSNAELMLADSVENLQDAAYDDILYFGSTVKTLETLFNKVANAGLVIIAQCGGTFGAEVETTVGRVHYGNIRIVGTTGSNPRQAMKTIPATGEIRPNDKINVVGAGGPMGVMHVVRNLCQGVEGVTVYAGDLDDERLESLSKICEPIAKKNNVGYVPYNPTQKSPEEQFDYVALMAPVPKLVAVGVDSAAEGGIINIFAGIPAHVTGPIDMDAYCQKGLYFIGTSGSTLDDMITVLKKVQDGSLDTNISVAAVSGLGGAIDGIRAVENHAIPGKIIVYPDVDIPLTRLEELKTQSPAASEKLADGLWTKDAEDALNEK